MRISDEAQAAGYRLVHTAATGSTNEDALALADGGDPGLVWVVTDMQTAGRGRHGRVWHSPPGNLYASVLLVDPCAPSNAAEIGFVAGLALHEAAGAVTGAGFPALSLKWPNDLLVHGAKTAGLLLEGRALRGGGFALVAGFGVNVGAKWDGAPYATATLRDLKPDIDRDKLFVALTAAWTRRLAAWRRGGLAPVLRAWSERAAGLGQPVTIRSPAGERHGTFRGLDARGRLILDTAAGDQIVDAGDLFLPTLSAAGSSGS